MYLEHCHPILNYDIALTMALIAIIGSKYHKYLNILNTLQHCMDISMQVKATYVHFKMFCVPAFIAI